MEIIPGVPVSPLLKLAFSVVEWISRRAALKAIDYGAEHFDTHRQTLIDISNAIEKDTTLILRALNSQQQANLKSAYDHIEMALTALGNWNMEADSQSALTVANTSNSQFAAASSSYAVAINDRRVNSESESTNFKLAMKRLYDAEDLAIAVFNDPVNSSTYIRVDALHVRIFCLTLMHWDNKKLCLSSWKKVLAKLFTDKDLFRLAFKGQQSVVSRHIAQENKISVKLAYDRFTSLLDCLEYLIWRVIITDRTLLIPARDVIVFICENIHRLNPDSEINFFKSPFVDYVDNGPDPITILAYTAAFRDFCCVTIDDQISSRVEILAIDHQNRLVTCDESMKTSVIDISERFPITASNVFTDQHCLLSIAYAYRTNEVFVLFRRDFGIHVINMISGESYQLPDIASETDKYRLRCTPNGALFVSKNAGQCQFVKFISKNRFIPLTDSSRKNYQQVFDNIDNNTNSIIGMVICDNFVITVDIRLSENLLNITIAERAKQILNPYSHSKKNLQVQSWIVPAPYSSTSGQLWTGSNIWAVGYGNDTIYETSIYQAAGGDVTVRHFKVKGKVSNEFHSMNCSCATIKELFFQ